MLTGCSWQRSLFSARGGELFDFLTNSVRLSLKKTRLNYYWLLIVTLICVLYNRLIMQQLLSAVEHMHAHGVIHRDLKVTTPIHTRPQTSTTHYVFIHSQRTYFWIQMDQ